VAVAGWPEPIILLRVKLSDVKTLTFHKGLLTTSRRVEPVPQLSCLSGCEFALDEAVCEQIPGALGDPSWICAANIPEGTAVFDKVSVSCEGWDSPEDEYILEGSCGLVYNLISDPGPNVLEPMPMLFEPEPTIPAFAGESLNWDDWIACNILEAFSKLSSAPQRFCASLSSPSVSERPPYNWMEQPKFTFVMLALIAFLLDKLHMLLGDVAMLAVVCSIVFIGWSQLHGSVLGLVAIALGFSVSLASCCCGDSGKAKYKKSKYKRARSPSPEPASKAVPIPETNPEPSAPSPTPERERSPRRPNQSSKSRSVYPAPTAVPQVVVLPVAPPTPVHVPSPSFVYPSNAPVWPRPARSVQPPVSPVPSPRKMSTSYGGTKRREETFGSFASAEVKAETLVDSPVAAEPSVEPEKKKKVSFAIANTVKR
jgi:hypothetical protein